MPTVKILHCADLHIGSSGSVADERAQVRRLEALLTFENIIKLAKEENVKLILIAGDLLCSNSVERSVVNRIVDCIGTAGGIEAVFAAGNHDPLNAQSPFKGMRLPHNFHILPEKDSVIYFESLNTRVYGRSFGEVYMKGESRFSIDTDDSAVNIMCQHGDVSGDLSSNYNSITPEFIDNCGMDYIALGHVHKRSEIMRRKDTFFAYSGCAEGLGFDELGDKGVYIGNVGKGYNDLEFFRTSFRNYEKIGADVHGCEDSAAAAEKVLSVISEQFGGHFRDNLYKVVLTGEIPDGKWFDTNEIAQRLSREVYYAKVEDMTELCEDLDTLKNEKSLKGIFVTKMLRLIDENPKDEQKYKEALKIGLKAFTSEVGYNDD